MKVSSEEVKQAILRKTDEELYDVLYVHSGNYTPEAIEIAQKEFLARRVDADTLTQFSSAAKVLQRQEQANEEAPLDGSLKIVAFIVSGLFLGIPALLVYNRYVARGARRKAHEWGTCALAGFVLFVVLPLLLKIMNELSRR